MSDINTDSLNLMPAPPPRESATVSTEGASTKADVKTVSPVVSRGASPTTMLAEDDKLIKNRERNREHARRTRQRKKAYLENLQQKLLTLQAEHNLLQQSISECEIASILLGLSSPQVTALQQSSTAPLISDSFSLDNDVVSSCIEPRRKRQRFVSVDGAEYSSNSRPKKDQKIDWKAGILTEADGRSRSLSTDELDDLRRERNRVHAKMTRDRKKNFVSNLELSVKKLSNENEKMKEILASHVAATTVASLSNLGKQKL